MAELLMQEKIKYQDNLMTLTKDKLNIIEQKLILTINNIQGSVESKDRKIEKLGIIQSYKIIHSGYSALSNDIEALKRAIFIQWYAATEPVIFSGIGELIRENEEKNIAMVNNLIRKRKLDNEFGFMLQFYYSINNWYFNSFKNTDSLLNFFIANPSEFSIRELQNMENRGQMGVYWNSLNK